MRPALTGAFSPSLSCVNRLNSHSAFGPQCPRHALWNAPPDPCVWCRCRPVTPWGASPPLLEAWVRVKPVLLAHHHVPSRPHGRAHKADE